MWRADCSTYSWLKAISDKKVKHCAQLPCFFLSITSNLIISNRSVNTEPKPKQTNRPKKQNKQTEKTLRIREKIWKIWMRSILLVLALYICTLNSWSKFRIDVFIWEIAVAHDQSCVSQRWYSEGLQDLVSLDNIVLMIHMNPKLGHCCQEWKRCLFACLLFLHL